MKRLILFRHAKSSWGNDRLEDHARPLSGRGQRDAPFMAERLERRGIEPDAIITSSAERARATVALIAETLGGIGDRVRIEPKLYLAAPSTIIEIVAAQNDAISEVILVAHNPGLTNLANQLVPELQLSNLPTAGVVAMDFAMAQWVAIGQTQAVLGFYDYPKNRSPVA